MVYKNKKRSRFYKRKRPAIITGVIVLVLIIGALACWRLHDSSKVTPDSHAQLSASTKLEQQVGQQQANQKAPTGASSTSSSASSSDTPAKSSQSGNPAPAPAGNVTPIITYPVSGPRGEEKVSAVEVDAFIPGVEENGGTCTLTLSGSGTITKSNPASLSGQSTSCQNFYVSQADGISAGSWTAVVSYKSATYQGSSQPVTFTVY